MKTGLSLQQMASELQRQKQAKRDFIVPTSRMQFRVDQDTDRPVLLMGGMKIDPMPLRKTAHQQFGTTLGIPKPYYDRMLLDCPDLLCRNLNHWLTQGETRRLVRTLDGEVRALLSSRYRPLDNFDLAEAVLPQLMKLQADVLSTQITEDRFYLKASTERIRGEVRVNDVVQAGIVVSNSEVGMGTLKIEEMDYRLVCLNGMIRGQAVRKKHIGRSNGHDALEDAREFYRDDTRRLEDASFFAKVRDATDSMFDQGRFLRRIEEYKDASERKIDNDPVKVVEVLSERLKFDEGEKSGVLQHLIKGGDLSQWGLANAVTRASQDVDDYTRATELEALGGQVIELSKSDWRDLAITPET